MSDVYLEIGRLIFVVGKTAGNYLRGGEGGGGALKGAACVSLLPHPVLSLICLEAGMKE